MKIAILISALYKLLLLLFKIGLRYFTHRKGPMFRDKKTDAPDREVQDRGAYHLTEKSGWGVESIMVSDLPVYRGNATSVTVSFQKKNEFCSVSLEPRNWLMVSNMVRTNRNE